MTDLGEHVRSWTDAANAGVAPVTVGDTLALVARNRSRSRRRRTQVFATVGLAAVLAGAAVVTVDRDDNTKVVTAPSTTAQSADSATPGRGDDDYDISSLLRDLGGELTTRRPGGSVAAGQLLDDDPVNVCVAGRRLEVYEYPSLDRRAAVSGLISTDGSQVPAGEAFAILEWIAPPNFYARGRIIVLYLAPPDDLKVRLEDLLGPSLSPEAAKKPSTGHPSSSC